ncbi:MAG: 2Fe-2S iron-sulfur cluster-binding protein, partial [Candidatus Pacebacteria bacterium]|nr:2Fe-2S iron-sulfur cluster-binding protein [Candidatus Paceibacterota bacterium]
MINIEIDGKKLKVEEGKTILEIARENNIEIPSLCYHEDVLPKEGCRLCLVEIEGMKGLHTSCGTYALDNMVIRTKTKEILETRKTNLKLLFAQHVEKCNECVWNNRCKMLDYAKKWKVSINEWEDRKKDYPKYIFGNTISYDSSKCINCFNCVQICQNQ